MDACEMDMLPTCSATAAAATPPAAPAPASSPPAQSLYPPPPTPAHGLFANGTTNVSISHGSRTTNGSSTAPACVVVDDEDPAPTFETNAIRAAPGAKPYFEGWHGQTAAKSFVHDAHGSKGQLRAIYRPVLPSAGCYAVQEWHPTGGYYCLKYMPLAAPLTVRHAHGSSLLHVDQHVSGGRWNTLGAFAFGAGAAELTLENNGTTGCEYGAASFGEGQMCYWTADALRLVRVGAECAAAPPSENTLVATCLAAATSTAPPAPAPPSGHTPTFADAATGRSLSVALASEVHVSEGGLVLEVTATGFGAGAALAVEIVHGSQALYLLGSVPLAPSAAGANATATPTSVALTLPNLHQLVEYCSSCTLHSGDWEVRLTEQPASGATAAVVHTPPFAIAWQ